MLVSKNNKNREISNSSGTTLTLINDADCWGDSCAGWGYFINNHLATLDTEGEWYYDESSAYVYIYSEQGVPADNAIEGSVVMTDDDRDWGGIVLGIDLGDHIHDVALDQWVHVDVFQPLLGGGERLDAHDLLDLRQRVNVLLRIEDFDLVVLVGIAQSNAHQKAIQLRLG